MAAGWPKGKPRGPMSREQKDAISRGMKGRKLSKRHKQRIARGQRERWAARRREQGGS